MSDQQVKEFFSSVLEGGPADRLDLDRAVAAGRRRRRIRTAATLGSAAAVLVVVGALVVSALPDDGRADLGGANLSPTPSATVSAGPEIIGGTADDWARAMESFLPNGTQTPAVYASAVLGASMPGPGNARAAFRLVLDGRATALVVSAYATVPESRTGSEVVAARLAELEQSCGGPDISCDPRVETSAGPVIVRRWADNSHVAASSVRASGVVVTVDSWNGDTDKDQILDGSGGPGLIDDLDTLVTLAASVPLPALLVTTPTPVPSTDAPTAEPSPTVSGFGPGPTFSPSISPATGLRGVPWDGVCPTTASADEPAALPIAGEVLTLRICPPLGWPASFGTQPVNLSTADGFKRLLDLLGRADQPFTPPTPSPDPTIQYGCPLVAQARPTVLVVTSTGSYRLDLPSYDMTPDGCTFIQEDVLTALMSALGKG